MSAAGNGFDSVRVPRVLAIGSCRLYRPMRALHARGSIDLVNVRDGWWFTHSSGEAVQYARAIAGEVTIPAHLRPLVCETSVRLPDDLARPDWLDVDLVTVEVSSLRALHTDGYRLNYSKVSKAAKQAGIDPKLLVRDRGDLIDWPAGTDLLRSIRVGTYTRDEIHRDLGLLARGFRAVVTVDHLDAVNADGGSIRGRREITDILSSAGLPFYGTRGVIERHGRETALLDSAHYRNEFHLVVGEDMLACFELALARSPAAT